MSYQRTSVGLDVQARSVVAAALGARDDPHQSLKAAVGCFSRYGLRRTTMDDVAAAAAVSRKTVYNYFTNKSALIAEVIFEEARKVNARAHKGLDLQLPAAQLLVEAELALLASARRSGYIEILLNPTVNSSAACSRATSRPGC